MPRLSTSPKVKTRIRILLKTLLCQATPVQAEQDYSSEQFDYRWQEETTSHPRLVIKTRLNVLAELIASELGQPVSKSQLREALLVMQKELEILVDHRIKTRGSDKWEFTLNLWDTTIERNLREFDRCWAEYKAAQTAHSKAPSRTPSPSTRLPPLTPARPLHNLRLRDYGQFVDAQAQLEPLLTILAPNHPAAIATIVGPGGIGKTTLALEAAHRCLAATQDPASFPTIPTFDAIIFVSAQTRAFIGPHLSQRLQSERNLKDMLREIARTVDRLEGLPTELSEQIEYIQKSLRAYRTLLILDNLETFETLDPICTFVPLLPPTVKVILTSRRRLGIGTAIELDYLSTQPAYTFIEQQSRDKLVRCDINQLREIYRLSGGLPLAMAYIVGHLAVYEQLPQLTRSRLSQAPHELAQYCAAASLNQLEDQQAYRLLLSATLFADKIPLQAAAYIVGLPESLPAIRQKFDMLYQLSLVTKLDANAYAMHSLTHEYVRTKFDAASEFKHQAQERWVAWYLKRLSPFGDDWQDWQDYDVLQHDWANIRTVVEWCIAAGHYQQVWQAWQGLRSYTLYRGYWDERTAWMAWLLQEAQRLDDRAALTKAFYYQGQTLAHTDETDASGKAFHLFKQAWSWREGVGLEFQFEIVSYLVALSLRQNHLQAAQTWLNEGQALLDQVGDSPSQHLRQQCQLAYLRGERWFRCQQYETAREHYAKALELAEATQWRRVTAYIKGWMARLLLAQDQDDEAARFLTESLDAAQAHRDKRSSAQCYYTFAQMAKRRGDRPQLQEWVTLAHQEFQQLGMLNEAKAVKRLLRE
jgi:hypothetical protein